MQLNFHDWEIVGVSIDRNKATAEIFIVKPGTNEGVSFLFDGVRKFYLSNMMIQNVILDLLLFEKASDSDYFGHCCSLLDIDASEYGNLFSGKMIYIEPSVGAEIACYYEEMHIKRGGAKA